MTEDLLMVQHANPIIITWTLLDPCSRGKYVTIFGTLKATTELWMQLTCRRTCDQRLVSHGAPLNHLPVDGELSSRDDFDDVAPLDELHRHLLLPVAHTG